MPTWTGNILQTYKVYRDERVCTLFEIRKLTAEYGYMIQYQWFERIVSGRFSPLIRFSGPRPLHFPLPLPLRSHALVNGAERSGSGAGAVEISAHRTHLFL